MPEAEDWAIVPAPDSGRDYRSGEAKGAPACVKLKTYPVKVESGTVFIALG